MIGRRIAGNTIWRIYWQSKHPLCIHFCPNSINLRVFTFEAPQKQHVDSCFSSREGQTATTQYVYWITKRARSSSRRNDSPRRKCHKFNVNVPLSQMKKDKNFSLDEARKKNMRSEKSLMRTWKKNVVRFNGFSKEGVYGIPTHTLRVNVRPFQVWGRWIYAHKHSHLPVVGVRKAYYALFPTKTRALTNFHNSTINVREHFPMFYEQSPKGVAVRTGRMRTKRKRTNFHFV